MPRNGENATDSSVFTMSLTVRNTIQTCRNMLKHQLIRNPCLSKMEQPASSKVPSSKKWSYVITLTVWKPVNDEQLEYIGVIWQKQSSVEAGSVERWTFSDPQSTSEYCILMYVDREWIMNNDDSLGVGLLILSPFQSRAVVQSCQSATNPPLYASLRCLFTSPSSLADRWSHMISYGLTWSHIISRPNSQEGHGTESKQRCTETSPLPVALSKNQWRH